MWKQNGNVEQLMKTKVKYNFSASQENKFRKKLSIIKWENMQDSFFSSIKFYSKLEYNVEEYIKITAIWKITRVFCCRLENMSEINSFV